MNLSGGAGDLLVTVMEALKLEGTVHHLPR